MHRNLKPDNVLVERDDQVKLSDFSLCRLALIPHVAYTPEDPKERERSGREARRLWYRAPLQKEHLRVRSGHVEPGLHLRRNGIRRAFFLWRERG